MSDHDAPECRKWPPRLGTTALDFRAVVLNEVKNPGVPGRNAKMFTINPLMHNDMTEN